MNATYSLPDACTVLISHPEAQALFSALQHVTRLPPELPVELSDEAAVLNPLLALYRSNRKEYETTLALIEAKRELKGRAPLAEPTGSAKFEKNPYQAGFMQEKRVLERRAVEIENDRRPGKDQLIGNARNDFMKAQAQQWNVRRKALLAAARLASGGTIRRPALKDLLQQFWDGIEAELTAMEEENRRNLRR